jgi:hypothetical protein
MKGNYYNMNSDNDDNNYNNYNNNYNKNQYYEIKNEPYEDTNNHKHDHECIPEYTACDMEIDLLNLYGSLYEYNQSSITDIKAISKIEQKYTKLKNKNGKYFSSNNDIKKLFKDIDEEMLNYKKTLNEELQKKQSVFNNFKSGFGIGLGLGMAISAYIYVNNKCT